MKRLFLILILLPVLLCSGCLTAFTQAQARNKFPATNGEDGHMEFGTIYGFAGEMNAAKVTTTIAKNGDKIQTFKGYSEKFTSPVGHVSASFGRISFRNGKPVVDPAAEAEKVVP